MLCYPLGESAWQISTVISTHHMTNSDWKVGIICINNHSSESEGFSRNMPVNINGKVTSKLGGIITFPVGTWRTIFSPSNSHRSHLDWLISKAQGRSSISRVLTHGFHTDNFTRIGLSHWESCSLLFQTKQTNIVKRIMNSRLQMISCHFWKFARLFWF